MDASRGKIGAAMASVCESDSANGTEPAVGASPPGRSFNQSREEPTR
jgi:hypothetical protein